jgi:hypothetical protein
MPRLRVPQPPVVPQLRDPEHHAFGPGFAVALVALALLVIGALNLTGVQTQDDESARETQLVKAFARGGLQFQEARVRFDPATLADPGRAAAAMDQAARIADLPLRDRYRVNTTAAHPCPT